jgi:REP element-mobilizing transposase RayT
MVWTTKGRAPILKGNLEQFVHRRLGEIADDLDLRSIAVNSAWDHTHSLVEWNTSLAFKDAIKEMKSRTSVEWLNLQKEKNKKSTFKWQGGGGIWSVDKDRVGELARYIVNQKDIHRERRTRKEFELKATM